MRGFLRKYWYVGLGLGVLLTVYTFSLPKTLFQESYSTVIEDRENKLLGASIAPDGQWRFPEGNNIPDKFKTAIVLFEDKRFYSHPGVDVRSLIRATQQNLKAGKIVSGGSTLSMQVIRLSRNKQRTFFEKLVELILATRLELRYSKEEIVALYAAHAPFGGNVVGIEAACWRYFGRDAEELSWSEAALLAVLPNNPALIHPGKNRDELKAKRDRLLLRLLNTGNVDSITYQLSVSEPIPENPVALPRLAPHLLGRVIKEGYAQTRVVTSIDKSLQERLTQLVNYHHEKLKGNRVFNAAAIIVEVKTGRTLAYVGNTASGPEHDDAVDIVTARRSTGSILKPILFAALLDEGKLLPTTLQPDVPTLINGFAPQNFTKEYDGAVPANQALTRSLNIPAVHQLRDYRYEKFYELLKNTGITTLNQPADHYGLSMILGGAEASLWEVTGVYASMARTLHNFFEVPGSNRYSKNDFHAPVYRQQDSLVQRNQEASSWLSAAAIYLTFDVLQEVYRPGEQTGWRMFQSSKKIAWKTGTSHGLRDAWAVGVNGDYAVGVWAGNADGEGRPGLTGTESAAPLMFDIFGQLSGNTWFQVPGNELYEIEICSSSGMRATELCEIRTKQFVTQSGLQSGVCRYHQLIHLSQDRKYRVHASCEQVSNMITESRFILPPVQEYYYKAKNISYKTLPPMRSDCANPTSVASMDILYPRPNARVFVPRLLDGQQGSVVFEATHRQATASVYWHMDGNYMATTKGVHRVAVSPGNGKHRLTLVDESGNIVEQVFSIISEN
ncbi:MAG TPA: penicillin-binding protein 1C [Cyclobacteriaceae bacterium]|jgi:penicillin-binding protein 1C|nr:penicillin-binding protein 1C [Cyclobacteriaceae bacterium]HRF34457.1 penicillin-binding protein 1C [Cyclobacteriaceae bacterium]